MIRLRPRSLFGQTALILLAGLLVSHLVGAWIYASDRQQAVRAVGGWVAAQRIANLTSLLAETPAAERPRVVEALSDPVFRVFLTEEPPPEHAGEQEEAALLLADFLAQRLPEAVAESLRVAVSGPAAAPPPDHHHRAGRRMLFRGEGGWRGLRVALQLEEGQWLGFATALPARGPETPWSFFLAMAVMGAIVLAACFWAVRRVTAPLGALAAAAGRLGRDVGAAPLPERGTLEMRRAARAFNEMQERLRRLVENRTRLLAAISHDLRTPLTLLRLRAEGVESAEERERMLATIAEMDAMIGATLAYARDEAAAEPRRRSDLTALLGSLVDDLAEAGLPVALAPAEPLVLDCQPAALRRALVNLLDNAVKYGGRAEVSIRAAGGRAEILVEDAGPGLPEAELARVFQPFYRVEASRSRETGGIGLGLAIAAGIVEAHGGEIALENRPEGGLRARVTLPL